MPLRPYSVPGECVLSRPGAGVGDKERRTVYIKKGLITVIPGGAQRRPGIQCFYWRLTGFPLPDRVRDRLRGNGTKRVTRSSLILVSSPAGRPQRMPAVRVRDMKKIAWLDLVFIALVAAVWIFYLGHSGSTRFDINDTFTLPLLVAVEFTVLFLLYVLWRYSAARGDRSMGVRGLLDRLYGDADAGKTKDGGK